MAQVRSAQWLNRLGYEDFSNALHRNAGDVQRSHPYSIEIRSLLNPEGDVRAFAVFEIDGVPAVCFVEGDPHSKDGLSRLQSKIWNQGLISLIVVMGGDALRVLPAVQSGSEGELVTNEKQMRLYSAAGVQSAAFAESHREWLRADARIDSVLLKNLKAAVLRLEKLGQTRLDAQHLMAQVMFVSYLEARKLIPRSMAQRPLLEMIKACDNQGLSHLFAGLKDRFNGDFLEPRRGTKSAWLALDWKEFEVVSTFLSRGDLESGQDSLWPYDFSVIPVELLSSIYESFIGDDKQELGAYYTPRHLANLAVSEAFAGIENCTEEIVYDGACGSGILLTTAFRRMLGAAAQQRGRSLTLSERSKLLSGHIYGSDINESACKVTAFSLYLALLEELDVKTVGMTKLPDLEGVNLFSGKKKGNVFGPQLPLAQLPPEHKPTLMISNPPWREPSGDEATTFDAWLKEHKRSVSLRQIAQAYAHRAIDLVRPGGRLCLILPAGAFAKPQNASFAREWLGVVNLERLINFADLRQLLFAAKHPCMVAVARVPKLGAKNDSDAPLTFEYLTPKADLSLLYRRLTIHSSDRHVVSTALVRANPEVLQQLYWGSRYEMAEIEILRDRGTFHSYLSAKPPRLVSAKGFMPNDRSIKNPIRPDELIGQPFIDANTFPAAGPVLPESALSSFPGYETIRSYGDMRVYEGERVLFTDGLGRGRHIRACHTAIKASFTNSIAAIRDLNNDPHLMRFVAAYLSSDLAAYFTLLTAPTAVLERTQVKLDEVEHLPFCMPEDHPDPDLARRVIREVSAHVEKSQQKGFVLEPSNQDTSELDNLLYQYFSISPTLVRAVEDAREFILDNVQPTTLSHFPNALQQPPSDKVMRSYRKTLTAELERYRSMAEGQGKFLATSQPSHPGAFDRMGIVVIAVQPQDADTSDAEALARAAQQLMPKLKASGLLGVKGPSDIQMANDVLVWSKNAVAIAKPLVTRLWLTSAAMDDAARIVQNIPRAS